MESAFSMAIAREVLEARLRAHGQPDPAAEGDGDGDVEGGKLEAFGDADLLVVLVQDAEIEASSVRRMARKLAHSQAGLPITSIARRRIRVSMGLFSGCTGATPRPAAARSHRGRPRNRP